MGFSVNGFNLTNQSFIFRGENHLVIVGTTKITSTDYDCKVYSLTVR